VGARLGLTAQDFGEVGRLAALADNPHAAARPDIYGAVASLYQSQGARLSGHERDLMRDILRRLTADVEMAVRITVAEKIADDPEAPLDLILFLVDDRIEVARPLILRSVRWTDDDLLQFIREADMPRQAICAQRPNIGERVTEALAQSDAEPVLVALVRNATARIAESTFSTLVQKSKSIAVLQEPLVHRLDLPPQLASNMREWVSDALKSHIVRRYQVSRISAGQALDHAMHRMHSPQQATDGSHKLVEKLVAAGQLKAGFLLRVLNQGQIDLFDIAFARLLGLDQAGFRRVLYEGDARGVALACRAVGIDRCVFQTVFTLSRQAHRIVPQLSNQDRADVDVAFASYGKAEAMARVRTYT